MNKKPWIFVFLIIFLLGLIFLSPQSSWTLKNFFSQNLISEIDNDSILIENTALKSELAVLENIKSQLSEGRSDYITASVFSLYPMNFRSEFLVNVGKRDGVLEGSEVLFQNVLVGKIKEVFTDTALVQTVFDDDFELAVRISFSGADGLLRGGISPKIVLISKSEKFKEGDAIYSSSVDFRYGLAIGLIKGINISSDDLFLEADVLFPYEISSIKAVLIKK